MIVSAIGFSVIQGTTKYLGDSVGAWTKAFYRSFFGIIFLVIWLVAANKKIVFNNIPVLLSRGIFGGLSLAFSFLAIDILDLSRATFYLYTYPIIAPFFASLFFKERFKALYVIPLIISCFGIFFISSINDFSFSYKDIIGVASGLFAGIAISTLKELRKTNEAESIYFCFCFISIIVCALGAFYFNESFFKFNIISGFSFKGIWIFLILVGALATVSQLFMTYSYKNLSTTLASILSLFTMPLSVLYGVFIFKEKVGALSIFGGLLIFASAVISGLVEKDIIRLKK